MTITFLAVFDLMVFIFSFSISCSNPLPRRGFGSCTVRPPSPSYVDFEIKSADEIKQQPDSGLSSVIARECVSALCPCVRFMAEASPAPCYPPRAAEALSLQGICRE